MKEDGKSFEKRAFLRLGWNLNLRRMQVAALLLIALCALMASWYNAHQLQSALQGSTRDYLSEVAGQLAENIDASFMNKLTELTDDADIVANLADGEPAQLRKFLRERVESQAFVDLIYLDADGGVTSGGADDSYRGRRQGFRSLEVVREAMEEGVSGMKYYGGENLVYAVPVENNGEIQGALVGIRSKALVQSFISGKQLRGRSLSCIIDRTTQRVLLAADDDSSFRALERIFGAENSGTRASVEAAEKDFEESRPGILKFDNAQGDPCYLAYNFLSPQDWVLMTIIPANLLSWDTELYASRTFWIIGGSFFIVLLFVVLLYQFYDDSRRSLARLAYRDEITGGVNNVAFQKLCEENPIAASAGCAVVIANIRNFKRINETEGMNTGDALLRWLYGKLEASLDPNLGEFAARSEMDRFFLRLRAENNEQVLERLNALQREAGTFESNGARIRVRLRFGVCMASGRDRDILLLQNRARMALGELMPDSGESCCFYDEKMEEKRRREEELDGMFTQALVDRAFELYLQPRVSARTERIAGAEALVRWRMPDGSLLAPGEFIPLFERSGRIRRLDMYMAEETCRELVRRRELGLPLYPVSVNMSRSHFSDLGFLDAIARMADCYGIDHGLLELELTETMFSDEEGTERIRQGIRRIHELGFSCAMDDFGAGFSSLGLLKEFDVDVMKLDRSFFHEMSGRGREVVESLIALSRRLNMHVVAEGVEDEETWKWLSAIGCDEVQGYYFSRPLAASEYRAWEARYSAERK